MQLFNPGLDLNPLIRNGFDLRRLLAAAAAI
jgi:hypothetical protein